MNDHFTTADDFRRTDIPGGVAKAAGHRAEEPQVRPGGRTDWSCPPSGAQPRPHQAPGFAEANQGKTLADVPEAVEPLATLALPHGVITIADSSEVESSIAVFARSIRPPARGCVHHRCSTGSRSRRTGLKPPSG
ncbi:MAG: hypothetical protein U0359_39675 [Byssovorax sp.]